MKNSLPLPLVKKIYLHTGSNVGERLTNLQVANEAIALQIGTITSYSKIYETAAWGLTDQAAFLNQALSVSTDLSPQEVLEQIHEIEAKMGRERVIKWGCRLIDIDILFYENEVINTQTLIVPHQHLHERNFVLIPLVDIAPNIVHPILKKTISELSQICTDRLEVSEIR